VIGHRASHMGKVKEWELEWGGVGDF
jgi:hypothetical protein